MKDIIIDLQESDIWKIQLTMAINFISSKDVDEERLIYTKSDSKQFMTYDNVKNIVDELFNTRIIRYQDNFKKE